MDSVAPVTVLPDGARFVDAFVFDVNGIARGKRLPAHAWSTAASDGVAFSASSLILDATGASRGPRGLGTEDGDPDAIADPVPGRLAPVPWTSRNLAQSLLAMRGPLWFDPRTILARTVARCHASGLHPVVACELEFCLVQPDARLRPAPPPLRDGLPPGSAGHLCVQRIEEHGDFLHGLHDALAAQGIAGGAIVSEYGPGQFEVNLPHRADPLSAADDAALLRRAVQGVAASQGLRASFMAKPYPEHPGNGLHIHLSLADAVGSNRFAQPGGDSLLRQAIGGMQALHAESLLLFAPNFSAFRRFGGAFVARTPSWGENRRDVAFRIPAGNPAHRRIEHRVASADASPHLAMAAILAALHHGVTRALDPRPEPAALPDFFKALELCARAPVLADYIGAEFLDLYATLKQVETRALFETIADAEYRFYL